jgi:hypothetical protein
MMETEDSPETADMADYEEKTGRSVDYVLVWGGPSISAQSNDDSPLWKQLRARYTLIYSSADPSPLRLFRKNVQEHL